MPFASKTNTQMLSKRSKPTFLYAFRGSKGCLQEGTDRKKNERRKRDRDRVCCLYRNRLGGAKARLRAAEFDGVGRGGERTATQTGSGGSLGNRTVSTIRRTPDCHRARAIAWITSVHASQV